jgi:pimeloyl-ACP methyl ester carboxylesterase
MPVANIRGAHINYEVLGESGPWVALSPGGRAPMQGVRAFGAKMADAGYRVVLHDRRNCGESDLVLQGEDSEYEIWADDLYELLRQLDAIPAIVGGNSSGCRLSVLFAVRHPEAVSALLLWRLTGGPAAAARLAQKYYGDFIDAARDDGMAGVCRTGYFAERFARRPGEREQVMALDPQDFIAAMTRWRDNFLASADQPIIGATADELRGVSVPVVIMPGNDKSHTPHNARQAQRLLPDAELHELLDGEVDLDVLPIGEWYRSEAKQLAIFLDFLERKGLGPASMRRVKASQV